MKKAFRAVWLLFSLLLAGTIYAGEIAAPGSISAVAVTVFADRALVTRTAEVALPKGETTVVISGLPANLITESVRVKGQGPAGLVIGSVETRPVFSEKLVREQQLADELTRLKDEQRVLENHIKGLQARLKLIESIGQAAPTTIKDEIARGKLAPETWKQAWMTVGTGATETYAEIHKIEIQKRDLDSRVSKKEAELAQVRTGRRDSLEARIQVAAPAAGSARLAVDYQVRGASWVPLYDARLDTDAAKLALAQLAQVQQNTGEDWTGVRLTLSTARPAQSAQMPELSPWFLDFVRLAPSMMKQEAAGVRRKTLEEAKDMALSPEAAPAEMQQAQAVTSEFAAEYRIPGILNVPSDNTHTSSASRPQIYPSKSRLRQFQSSRPKPTCTPRRPTRVPYRCCPAASPCSAKALTLETAHSACCARAKNSSSRLAWMTGSASSINSKPAGAPRRASSTAASASNAATA